MDREAHDVRMYGPVQYPRLVRGGCPNRHNGDARDCGQRAAASVDAHSAFHDAGTFDKSANVGGVRMAAC